MPDYKQLTVKADFRILGELLTKLEKIDTDIADKKTPEVKKSELKLQKKQLVGQVGPLVDRVLQGCDVAEWNNQTSCKYMKLVHEKAKVDINNLNDKANELQKNWNEKVASEFKQLALALPGWQLSLKTDDQKLLAVDMVENYRNNGWKTKVEQALAYAPEKKAAVEQRLANRENGIKLSTETKALSLRVGEYVQRAAALQKTVHMLEAKSFGMKENRTKLEKEATEFVNSTIDSVTKLRQSVGQRTKTAMESAKIKKLDQKIYKDLAQVESNVAAALKELKGKKKTVEAQRDNLRKRLKEANVDFSAGEKKINEQINLLEIAVETTTVHLAPYYEHLKKGKQNKW
jgi:hypothetical protein